MTFGGAGGAHRNVHSIAGHRREEAFVDCHVGVGDDVNAVITGAAAVNLDPAQNDVGSDGGVDVHAIDARRRKNAPGNCRQSISIDW